MSQNIEVTPERKKELAKLFQELQGRILANDITLKEVNEILDREMPEAYADRDKAPKVMEGHAYIYAILDPEGRRAYVGRSTNPTARHEQILSGRVKSVLLRLWVRAMKNNYHFGPPMVILAETTTDDWYRVHREWVVRLQEGGEAYLNTL
jgi:hypothetical protein